LVHARTRKTGSNRFVLAFGEEGFCRLILLLRRSQR
jgi:hypothetical protein